jgi:hypothetical protein
VFATATLLAATCPLVQELISLQQDMEVTASAAGVCAWQDSWQSLMADIALMLSLCQPSDALDGGDTDTDPKEEQQWRQTLLCTVGGALLGFAAEHRMQALQTLLQEALVQPEHAQLCDNHHVDNHPDDDTDMCTDPTPASGAIEVPSMSIKATAQAPAKGSPPNGRMGSSFSGSPHSMHLL